MNARVIAVTGLVLASLLPGCLVPTYEELERERPRECDAAHPCSGGKLCVSGICQTVEDAECQPNTTEKCGNDEGACIAGTRTCGADGKFGPCIGEVLGTGESCNGVDDDCDGQTDEGIVGAQCSKTLGVCSGATARCISGGFESTCTAETYGPLYEETETLCDGQDNDCDGSTDESLRKQCPKQQGVCAGADVACASGAFPECTDATYLTLAANYEPFENTCDGDDNDCDGLADDWAPENVSPTGGASRNAAVVRTATGGLVLYEDGNTVVARAIGADGRLAPEVSPSRTLQFASRGFSPAVTSEGNTTYAAWVEELANGGFRVLAATLDDTGRSTLLDGTGAPSASPVYACLGTSDPCTKGSDCCSNSCVANACAGTPSRSITRVDLAASPTRLLFLIGEAGSNASLVAIGWPSTPIPPPSSMTFTRTFGGSPVSFDVVQRGQGFVIAYSQGNDIEVRTVESSGALGVANDVNGTGVTELLLGTAPGVDYVLYFANNAQTRIDFRACTTMTCPVTGTAVNTNAAASNLAINEDGSDPIISWVEGGAAYYAELIPSMLPATAAQLSPTGSTVARPVALPIGNKLFGFFDTEGSLGGSLPANEVILQRRCGP